MGGESVMEKVGGYPRAGGPTVFEDVRGLFDDSSRIFEDSFFRPPAVALKTS